MVGGLQGRPHLQGELAPGMELGHRWVGGLWEAPLNPQWQCHRCQEPREPSLPWGGPARCGDAGRAPGPAREGLCQRSQRFSRCPQGGTAVPGAPRADPSARCSPGPRTCVRRSGPAPSGTAPSPGAAAAASRCGSTPPGGTPTWPWPSTMPGERDRPLARGRRGLLRGAGLAVLCRALSCSCCPWGCSLHGGPCEGHGLTAPAASSVCLSVCLPQCSA